MLNMTLILTVVGTTILTSTELDGDDKKQKLVCGIVGIEQKSYYCYLAIVFSGVSK